MSLKSEGQLKSENITVQLICCSAIVFLAARNLVEANNKDAERNLVQLGKIVPEALRQKIVSLIQVSLTLQALFYNPDPLASVTYTEKRRADAISRLIDDLDGHSDDSSLSDVNICSFSSSYIITHNWKSWCLDRWIEK